MTQLPDGLIKCEIDHVKPSDCGAYKVVISNPMGESESICAVAVTRKSWLLSGSIDDSFLILAFVISRTQEAHLRETAFRSECCNGRRSKTGGGDCRISCTRGAVAQGWMSHPISARNQFRVPTQWCHWIAYRFGSSRGCRRLYGERGQ